MRIWILTAALSLMAAPALAVECNDGIDNDGDTLIDFPADPGCYAAKDRTEYNEPPVYTCNDTFDNDGDGLTDMEDPGCEYPEDNTETSPLFRCDDGFDNDGDTLADLDDLGCSNPWDSSEHCGGDPDCPECDDGINNELPGYYLYDDLIDAADPECRGPGNIANPLDISEYADCWDGRDNDGDGKVDVCKAWNLATCDPDCLGEINRFDEEGGGGATGGPNMSSRCGIGFELAFILPLLMGLRHVRQRERMIHG